MFSEINVCCVISVSVSPSSTQTEIRPGSSFTLSCQLYVDDGYPCDKFFINERIQLMWVNKAGEDLRSDSRYQISSSPHHCNITLTTTLLDEDHNTEWRCQVTKENKLKTSVRYTVTYSGKKTKCMPMSIFSSMLDMLNEYSSRNKSLNKTNAALECSGEISSSVSY